MSTTEDLITLLLASLRALDLKYQIATTMKNGQLTGLSCAARLDGRRPIGYLPYQPEPAATQSLVPSRSIKAVSVLNKVNKIGKKADNIARGVREHVRLGPKISETVKGKLSLGLKIFRVGGIGKIFRRLFPVKEGEKLLKCCQCYLSTTAGPIAGLLFVSTDKVAFCSERSIKFSSPDGQVLRYHYKVVIPFPKIKRIDQSEDAGKASQKYVQIVTADNFDFWFMGFLNYEKALRCLEQALPQA